MREVGLPALFEGCKDIATVLDLLHGNPHHAVIRASFYRDVLGANGHYRSIAAMALQMHRGSLLVATKKNKNLMQGL